MIITPLRAFVDNYIWILREADSSQIVVVDPGEAKPVLDYLESHSYQLAAILITHHHADHQGGTPELLHRYPTTPVYGPASEKILHCTYHLTEGDEPVIPGLSSPARVLDIPGHTAGHIAYYIKSDCFCGDTLFSAGCGRLFEHLARAIPLF